MSESGSSDTPEGVVASGPQTYDHPKDVDDQTTGNDGLSSNPNAQTDTDHPSGTLEVSVVSPTGQRVNDIKVSAVHTILVAVTDESGRATRIVCDGEIFVPREDTGQVIIAPHQEDFDPEAVEPEDEESQSQGQQVGGRVVNDPNLYFEAVKPERAKNRWRIPRIIINREHAEKTDRVFADYDAQTQGERADKYFATLDACTSDSSDSAPWAPTSPETQPGTVQRSPSTTEQ